MEFHSEIKMIHLFYLTLLFFTTFKNILQIKIKILRVGIFFSTAIKYDKI
jgi:hypothetical protein